MITYYRVGRRNRRIIYRQKHDRPSDQDELAELVVDKLNAGIEADRP